MPTPKQIIYQARNLRDDIYQYRDQDLRHFEEIRFGTFKPDVPEPYNQIASIYTTPAVHEQGMQIAALLNAKPTPYAIPPTPEDQETVTAMLKWLTAAHQELESTQSHAMWKARQSQIFSGLACIKSPLKRDFFSDAPNPPSGYTKSELAEWGGKNERYKKEAGVTGLFEYYHVPTDTIYVRGDVANPLAVYEIKEVEEAVLVLQYGLKVNEDNSFEAISEMSEMPQNVTTLPPGTSQTPRFRQPMNRKLLVTEYWDRDEMKIIVENPLSRWRRGSRNTEENTQYFVLDEWEHGWGRVPYFFAAAFETDSLKERYKYTSPLWALYREAPLFNSYMTMESNVMWLGMYPSHWIETPADGELTLDDEGNKPTHIAFKPGTFFQPGRGQKLHELPLESTRESQMAIQNANQRMKEWSLAPQAKGVSPGADTANASIANLTRLMQTQLDPLVDNMAELCREMYRFWLRRIQEDVAMTVYALDEDQNEIIALNPKKDIPTMNVQVKIKPDIGQDQLVIEKDALEKLMAGVITEVEYHEIRGKENPEEYVQAASLDRLRKRLEPTVDTYILAALGDAGAISQMVQAAQQGQGAQSAIPQVMAGFRQIQQGKLPQGTQPPPQNAVGAPPNAGMAPPAAPQPGANIQKRRTTGRGAPGQPRRQGVRSPGVPPTIPGQGIPGGMP